MSDVVERAKAALEGVTAGPWEQNGNNGVHTPQGECIATTAGHKLLPHGKPVRKANAEFIVAARSLVPELVAEIERLRKVTDIIDPDSVYREQAEHWKSLWRQNTETAADAMRERDAAVAGIERLRSGLSEMRDALNGMRHTGLCACFVDQAPESECDCSKSAVIAWIDHVAAALESISGVPADAPESVSPVPASPNPPDNQHDDKAGQMSVGDY